MKRIAEIMKTKFKKPTTQRNIIVRHIKKAKWKISFQHPYPHCAHNITPNMLHKFPKKNFTISKIRIEIPITMATMGISGYKFTQKCRKYVNTNNSEYLPELCYAQLLLLFVFAILPEKLLTLLKLFSVWY